MKARLAKYCGIMGLAVALGLSLPSAQAVMIGTQEAAATQAQVDRAKVSDFLNRASVQERLLAMGVSAPWAQVRAQALTDQEARLLAQRIDSLPAGGNLSTTEWILVGVIAILAAVVI
ncbi:MAG: PA2779 family protein [Gammaproteobacteria bacterium]|nr:PA2779 family protein [Gammaproteobacteria bacterium]